MIVPSLLFAALTGVVRGRAVTCNGTPLPGVVVTMTKDHQTQVSGLDGRFAFRLPPSSDIELTAELAGTAGARETVCVTADAETKVELLIPIHAVDQCITMEPFPKTQRMEGTVVSIEGRPIGNATVRIASLLPDRREVTARTNGKGRFRSAPLPFGRYDVEASARGYRRKTTELWVSPCHAACDGPLVIRLTAECR